MLGSIRYRILCLALRTLARLGAIDDRDLEIAVLRHQLRIMRSSGRRPSYTAADRAFLAAASRLLPTERWSSFLVGPDTLRRWHRELLRAGRRLRPRRPGRPPLETPIRELILRLGRENPRWGYLRIRGELLKLGVDVSATTIATVLRRSGLGPAPRRIGPTWTQFLRLQALGILHGGSGLDRDDDWVGDLGRCPARPASDPAVSVPPGEGGAGTADDEDADRVSVIAPRAHWSERPVAAVAAGSRLAAVARPPPRMTSRSRERYPLAA